MFSAAWRASRQATRPRSAPATAKSSKARSPSRCGPPLGRAGGSWPRSSQDGWHRRRARPACPAHPGRAPSSRPARPDILAHGGSPRRPLHYQLLPDLSTGASRRSQTHSFAWREGGGCSSGARAITPCIGAQAKSQFCSLTARHRRALVIGLGRASAGFTVVSAVGTRPPHDGHSGDRPSTVVCAVQGGGNVYRGMASPTFPAGTSRSSRRTEHGDGRSTHDIHLMTKEPGEAGSQVAADVAALGLKSTPSSTSRA
jgi:hypothetical protein